MGLRQYDPVSGRWLTRDPIGYSGGLNLYAYCDGDPVNFADPMGLSFEDDLAHFLQGATEGLYNGDEAFLNGPHNFASFLGTYYDHPACGVQAALGGLGASLSGFFSGLTGGDPVETGRSLGGFGFTVATAAAGGGVGSIVEGGMAASAGGAALAEAGGEGIAAAGVVPDAGEYLSGKAPWQIEPGSASLLEGQYMSGNRVQPWAAHYDEFGRQIGRTDYNASNPKAGIPDTHYHIYEYVGGRRGGNRIEIGSHIPGEFEP